MEKDVWQKVWDTIGHKKRINNITFLAYYKDTMVKFNTDPKSHFFQKLDSNIAQLKEKHYNADREWRYNFDSGEMRSLQELIDRRETAKIDDMVSGKGAVDQTLITRAIEAEKKMKRLELESNKVTPESHKRLRSQKSRNTVPPGQLTLTQLQR